MLSNNAATPDTCGAAADVPLKTVMYLSVFQLLSTILVLGTLMPGATTLR